MKQVKLYNVIFPIWFLLFFPPVIFITLLGNFFIDSLVLIACFYVFKLDKIQGGNLKAFYKKSILKVWLFGFLADIIGAAILFSTQIVGDYAGLSYELISAMAYDPFSHIGAFMIIVFAMLVSGLLIFLFNYKITFKGQITEKYMRIKVAVAIAVVTIPWTFLLPTKWIYSAF